MRKRHLCLRLRLLLAGSVPHRCASDGGLGKIQGPAPGRGLGDQDALEMISRGEASSSCPLPLRERAARRFNSKSGVRGRAATPHPTAVAERSAMPSPATGEGLPARFLALLLLLFLAAAPAHAADHVANFYP